MPLILSLAAPGSPCRLFRPSARLAGQWHSTHSTARHVPRHYTAPLILPACAPALYPRERRPTAQRTRSDAFFSIHDGISSFSTQRSATVHDDEHAVEEDGDNSSFLEREEGSQLEEEEMMSNLEERLKTHISGSPVYVEGTAHEFDMFDKSSWEESPTIQADKQIHKTAESPKSDAPHPAPSAPFKAQLSRSSRKKRRRSQPTTVLDSIQTPARDFYSSTPPGKTDLTHASQRRLMPGGHGRQSRYILQISEVSSEHATTISLYSIVSRHLRHLSVQATRDTPYVCTRPELEFLQHKNLSQETVRSWASSLLDPNSIAAASIFRHSVVRPPFYLVLLFLRRKHIRIHALGIILDHVSARLEQESISWKSLKIVVIRVLRHARRVWPESIPWISTLFTSKAASIHSNASSVEIPSSRTLGEITRFCNSLLSLLSLPSSLRPMIAARHQETAQLRILQFMAACEPSIAVTRTGFRAIARIQLTHGKTEQERDWAELKGPSWPPWKESRTAMDDDKGYEYGASRATKILHRMFEAGYAARTWEEVAEVYAGWDTDLSPTIQTRTLLPFGFRGNHVHRLWAARIRTTRTRREAWACFLAHETSGAPAHEEIYLAMFEKLYYLEAQRRLGGDSQQDTGSDGTPGPAAATLLPGDMKEVVADPPSPLHNVYLSEPLPTYEQLYRRMVTKKMRPTNRLLAFLLETYPDFATTYKLLEKAKDDFNGGVGCLITGNHGDTSTIREIPGYFLAAFIRFLCRFGHPTSGLSVKSTFLEPTQHTRQLLFNENYLLEYAYALLLHYKPRHLPAWTAFVERVVFSKFGHKPLYNEKESATGINNVQYNIVAKLLDTLASIDVDIEGDLFNLACTATRYAAQAVHRGNFPIDQGRDFLATRSYRLRKLFYHLVGAHADPEMPIHASSIPSHIPGPAELHAYVRALGILRDYEGLYSFSTWLTKNNVEVMARARAQHGGNDMLFRTLVALRAATGGWLEEGLDSRPQAPEEIRQLIKAQIESVEEWGGWPSKKHVSLYIEGHVRSATPEVGGR